MSYTSNEVKSGIFVTFSIALLLGLIFIIGRWATGATYTYYLRFGYVSGLEKNAPVYVAGTEMGKVDSIKIEPDDDKIILVTVRIPQHVVLHEDAEAFIDTLGMMGEKFVELSPGSLESPALKPGSLIVGLDPIPMHQIIEKMNLLADRMDELTVSLNPLVTNVNTLLQGNQEDITKMIANFEKTSANLRDMTSDLKKRPWRLLRKG
jgi:phospholipid/cholesterol/gamma-HCH transport system substrate-binding protein